MTLPFLLNGIRTVIPGVYDTFRVAGSLPAPAPAGRSVLILGESEEGIPGDELDLRLNFFTDYQSVKDFYKSGPIVDAARQLFSAQPSPAFAGAIQRLYVWKTNQTTRATKTISSPSNFGSLAAVRYGEDGNFIKSQIKASSESLPSKSFSYMPSPAAADLVLVVNGEKTDITVPASAGSNMVAALLAGAGRTISGGTVRTHIVAPNTVDASLSASGDILTITKTAGAGNFGTNAQLGDTVVIPEGTTLAGASDENAGAYLVTAWSATSISLRQIKRYESGAEANAVAFDTSAVTGIADTDLEVYAPISITVTASAATGAGASLELLGDNGGLYGAGNLFRYSDFDDILDAANAAIGSISASVPAANQLLVSLSGASWSNVPSVGDIVRIERGSMLEGAGLENVGLHIVTASTGSSLSLTSLYGLGTIAVASVALMGDTSPLKAADGWVSTSVVGLKTNSSAESQVWVEASKVTDGTAFPTTKVGGRIAFEMSCNLSGATACEVSIDANRVMTITPTGAGSELEIRLNKYKSLAHLADYINTQTGYAARIPDNRMRSLPTSVLDMVSSVPIMTGNGAHAYNGRLKSDYYDWKSLFDANGSLITFVEGAMVLKAGLPAAESSAGFLSGAAIGASTDADFQNGLDQAMKIDVRMVVPLVSRDARYDVSDGLTDADSSYSIDSINAAVRSHVATASSSLMQRERFGLISYHGSFDDTIQKCSEMSYERLQMTFQQFRATDSAGSLQWFAPWMGACAIAAGRAQSSLGTSMLRKTFGVTAVRHLGNSSLYSDSLIQDFDPEDKPELAQAIEAGLLCFRAVSGSGVRLESPDLTTRSRNNDPEGWVWERANVLFTCDEVRQTVRSAMENFIGNRQSDTPLAVVRTAAQDALSVFIGNGSLLNGSVLKIIRQGVGYKANIQITPTEALEFIGLEVEATRAPVAEA